MITRIHPSTNTRLPRFGEEFEHRRVKGFIENPDDITWEPLGDWAPSKSNMSVLHSYGQNKIKIHNLAIVASQLQTKLQTAGMADIVIRTYPEKQSKWDLPFYNLKRDKHSATESILIPEEARETGLYLMRKKEFKPNASVIQDVHPISPSDQADLTGKLGTVSGFRKLESGELGYEYTGPDTTRPHVFKVKFAPADHPWFLAKYNSDRKETIIEKALNKLDDFVTSFLAD